MRAANAFTGFIYAFNVREKIYDLCDYISGQRFHPDWTRVGGLMQDRTRFDRDQMPIVGNVPTVGEAFRFRNEQASKTELIIFLRPTVIENAGAESDELKLFQRYLPAAGGMPAESGALAP